MHKKRVRIKHWIEYLLFALFRIYIKVLPLGMLGLNRKIVVFLGKILSKKHFRLVEENLKIAFPQHSQEQHSKLLNGIYSHFSRVFLEIITLYIKKRPEKILKKIEVNNLPVLRNALKKKRGVILFSAHFGNWELVPYILSKQLDTKIVSIARKMDNPLMERLVKRFREKMGSTIIYKKNSIRTILKMLAKNKIIFMLIDQHTIDREAVYVDFFKTRISVTPSVSQLHLRKDKPIIPLFLHYEKDKIILDLMDEVQFKNTHQKQEDTKQLTQNCITMIEKYIKEYPEQWFWFHDRWKIKESTG